MRVACIHQIYYGDDPKKPTVANPGEVIDLPDAQAKALLAKGAVTQDPKFLPADAPLDGRLGTTVAGKAVSEEGAKLNPVKLPSGSAIEKADEDDDEDDEDHEDEDEDDEEDDPAPAPAKAKTTVKPAFGKKR